MKPRGIRIHCSGSTWGDGALIDEWHRQRGFQREEGYVTPIHPLNHIGYHAVILNGSPFTSKLYDESYDGMVQLGRREDELGAHAYGDNDTLGVCLVGKQAFTMQQMIMLHCQVTYWLRKYKLGIDSVLGHYETNHERQHGTKTCPNFNVRRFRDRLRGYYPRVAQYVGGI